jgi:hypothetical protein
MTLPEANPRKELQELVVVVANAEQTIVEAGNDPRPVGKCWFCKRPIIGRGLCRECRR